MTHRALEHRARAFVALLLVAIAGLTLAACGGDDGGGSTSSGDSADARALLSEAFDSWGEIRSGDATVELRLAEDGGQSLDMTVSGPFETQGDDRWPKYDISLDASLSGQGEIDGGAVSTSDRLYLRLGDDAYEIPQEFLDLATSERGADDVRRLPLPDIDPQAWVVDPEVVGQEEVGGVEADHVSAGMDVPAFLDAVDDVLATADREGLSQAAGGELPRSIPAETRREIETAVKDPRVDVWVGAEDTLPRKLEIELVVEREGERRTTLAFMFELDGVNEPQQIEAPQDLRPSEELFTRLGSLLGAAGVGDLGGAGSGSSGSGSGSGSGGADDASGQEEFDDYTRCLQDAGTDVAQQQECAALLR